jgi:hypothetical protein
MNARAEQEPLGRTATFHPYAELFGLLKGGQFAALVADIKQNGLRHPIVQLGGAILDGRNRYRACIEAGVPIRTEQWVPTEPGDTPLKYVVSVNANRRHLTESQRAMAAAKR